MTWWIDFVRYFFGFSLFVNALLFIPQVIKLFEKKDSSELSLVTFLGFNLIQCLALLNALTYGDWLSTIGWSLSVLTCGTITFLILWYR